MWQSLAHCFDHVRFPTSQLSPPSPSSLPPSLCLPAHHFIGSGGARRTRRGFGDALAAGITHDDTDTASVRTGDFRGELDSDLTADPGQRSAETPRLWDSETLRLSGSFSHIIPSKNSSASGWLVCFHLPAGHGDYRGTEPCKQLAQRRGEELFNCFLQWSRIKKRERENDSTGQHHPGRKWG